MLTFSKQPTRQTIRHVLAKSMKVPVPVRFRARDDAVEGGFQTQHMHTFVSSLLPHLYITLQ